MLTLLESRLVLDELGAADGSWAFAPVAEKRDRRAISFCVVDRTPGAVVAANNPINFTDPEGLVVNMIYNQSTGTLTAFNTNTGQRLTISGVFSGGGGYAPIPRGTYQVGPGINSWRNNPGNNTWYPLWGPTGSGGWTTRNINGTGRGGFYLHVGSVSHGCVTVPSNTNPYPNNPAFNILQNMLQNTTPQNIQGQSFPGQLIIRP